MAALQKVINGRTYSFDRCAAIEALDLELSLAKVGASEFANVDVAAFASLAGQDDALRAALGLQLAESLGRIAKNLTHAELVRLMTLVFQYVSCDGVTITNLNVTFADRPRDIWMVFVEALKVNLGPLGEGLLTKSPAQKPAT
jgi:hypothetical protein